MQSRGNSQTLAFFQPNACNNNNSNNHHNVVQGQEKSAIAKELDDYIRDPSTLPLTFTKEHKMELTHEFLRRVDEAIIASRFNKDNVDFNVLHLNEQMGLKEVSKWLNQALTPDENPYSKLFYTPTVGFGHSDSRKEIERKLKAVDKRQNEMIEEKLKICDPNTIGQKFSSRRKLALYAKGILELPNVFTKNEKDQLADEFIHRAEEKMYFLKTYRGKTESDSLAEGLLFLKKGLDSGSVYGKIFYIPSDGWLIPSNSRSKIEAKCAEIQKKLDSLTICQEKSNKHDVIGMNDSDMPMIDMTETKKLGM